jgi:glucokinase
MSDEVELSRYPSWRQAVQDCLREFKYGDMISHAWLAEHFGMPTMGDEVEMTAQDFRSHQFEWLSNIESFKNELLRDHSVLLQSVRGEGFRWVPPQEQTRIAEDAFQKDANRAFRSAGNKLRNIRVFELSDEQRRENVDAVAKMAAMKGMYRKGLK